MEFDFDTYRYITLSLYVIHSGTSPLAYNRNTELQIGLNKSYSLRNICHSPERD